MTIPTAAEIEAIRARDAIAHHPDRVADSGKIHVIGDYLEAAEAGIADRHRLLAALDAVNQERSSDSESERPVTTTCNKGGIPFRQDVVIFTPPKRASKTCCCNADGWIDPSNIPAACGQFVGDKRCNCLTCEHNYECHIV